jgi:hypothetical protein
VYTTVTCTKQAQYSAHMHPNGTHAQRIVHIHSNGTLEQYIVHSGIEFCSVHMCCIVSMQVHSICACLLHTQQSQAGACRTGYLPTFLLMLATNTPTCYCISLLADVVYRKLLQQASAPPLWPASFVATNPEVTAAMKAYTHAVRFCYESLHSCSKVFL